MTILTGRECGRLELSERTGRGLDSPGSYGQAVSRHLLGLIDVRPDSKCGEIGVDTDIYTVRPPLSVRGLSTLCNLRRWCFADTDLETFCPQMYYRFLCIMNAVLISDSLYCTLMGIIPACLAEPQLDQMTATPGDEPSSRETAVA